MSTKIYNAYEWHGTMDELMTVLMAHRKAYQEGLVDCLADSFFVKEYYKEHGMYDFELTDFLQTTLEKASKTQLRDPFCYDASASVVPHKGRIFVKFFGFDGHGYKNQLEHKNLVDYHYQNQCDKPEDVSDEEWDERRDTWDDILDNSETCSFSEVGMTYTFFNGSNSWWLSRLVFNKLNTPENAEKVRKKFLDKK